ncbi:peptide deformylase [Capnocytophaga canimorsus]|uniref:Peptide deformylase n=2 Tax=Capnocytophaga canimorsus TaxID=28188 RepID=F9YST9_CAPCC|nr:peptide deformylase [Capnocytophaga canimorsus]AEK23934.1 Polypeptide deformylase [Capnocytophaga canimorsus Cc5]ATA76932.1 peptide deformylase [Capnocytophaga canimorsus]ATA91512.1 peptide deformylase [Capnocytophaga canimorsus]ATA93651.1 peptide deformylase [Capnocytophaga canimorsus]AWL78402.1 peptide deformylase [Capnocytophaga canimorsus]
MILPIIAYGDPVLRKVCADITPDYPNLKTLIDNMFQTMEASHGVGLAAPQIGLPIRLFVIDAEPFSDDEDLSEEERTLLKNFRKVFINAKIVEETGEKWSFNEGCLSIPGVREDVSRHETLTIEFLDEHFQPQRLTVGGLAARVIQHEYDHIQGILFTDKLSAFKKQLLKGKLANISKGKVNVDYRMRFPEAKRTR